MIGSSISPFRYSTVPGIKTKGFRRKGKSKEQMMTGTMTEGNNFIHFAEMILFDAALMFGKHQGDFLNV